MSGAKRACAVRGVTNTKYFLAHGGRDTDLTYGRYSQVPLCYFPSLLILAIRLVHLHSLVLISLPSLQSNTCFSVLQTANKLLSVFLRKTFSLFNCLPVWTKFEIICMNQQLTSIERFALMFTGKSFFMRKLTNTDAKQFPVLYLV